MNKNRKERLTKWFMLYLVILTYMAGWRALCVKMVRLAFQDCSGETDQLKWIVYEHIKVQIFFQARDCSQENHDSAP